MVGAVRGLEGHKSIWQREKTAEGLRREVFPLFSPPSPAKDGMARQHQEGRRGRAPSPPSAITDAAAGVRCSDPCSPQGLWC